MGNISGTEKAEQVFREYADMIYRIALHNLSSSADAEDILQEVCLVLMTKPSPEDEVHLKRWLIRVTINKCKNFKRSFWQRNRQSIDDFSYITAPEKREMMEELYSLPENYRNIIFLYYFEEYTIPEIAEILEKNENTVKSSLQRARKRLKKILTEEGEENEK